MIFRTPQEVYLNQGQEIVLQNPGFESGEFIEGCEVLDDTFNRPHYKLVQGKL